MPHFFKEVIIGDQQKRIILYSGKEEKISLFLKANQDITIENIQFFLLSKKEYHFHLNLSAIFTFLLTASTQPHYRHYSDGHYEYVETRTSHNATLPDNETIKRYTDNSKYVKKRTKNIFTLTQLVFEPFIDLNTLNFFEKIKYKIFKKKLKFEDKTVYNKKFSYVLSDKEFNLKKEQEINLERTIKVPENLEKSTYVGNNIVRWFLMFFIFIKGQTEPIVYKKEVKLYN